MENHLFPGGSFWAVKYPDLTYILIGCSSCCGENQREAQKQKDCQKARCGGFYFGSKGGIKNGQRLDEVLLERPTGLAVRWETGDERKESQGWLQGFRPRQLKVWSWCLLRWRRPRWFINTTRRGGKKLEFGLALDKLNMRCRVDVQVKKLNRQLNICVRGFGGKV